MADARLKRFINCNKQQCDSMFSTGSAVIGGKTVQYDLTGDILAMEYHQYLHRVVGYFERSAGLNWNGTIFILNDSATPITATAGSPTNLLASLPNMIAFSLARSNISDVRGAVIKFEATSSTNITGTSTENDDGYDSITYTTLTDTVVEL